jgi:hypothetical protein
MLKFQSYSIKKLLLTNQVLEVYINKFWDDIFSSLIINNESKYLMVLCKVDFISNLEEDAEEVKSKIEEGLTGYRTLGNLRKVNFDDKELFIEYLTNRLGSLTESYVAHPISRITFTYVIKEGLAPEDRALLNPSVIENNAFTHRFYNLNLPISMNPSEYGDIVVDNHPIKINGETINRFMVENGTRTYRIDVSNNGLTNHVKIQGAIDLSWIDTIINGTVIKREIKKSTIYFMDGEIVLRKQQLNNKYFQLLKKEKKYIESFYTIDIETVKLDNKLTPYLICAFDGTNYITSYNKNQKELFNSFFEQLLSKIKSGTKTIIYAHNLSGFDGIFLMKHLLPLGKVEPLLFNGKLMSIKVRIGSTKSNTKTIVFKDSYLLLPLSLRKLCAAFEIELGKGYFPFLLKNIYYSGVLPNLEYWTGISLSEYELFKSEYKNKMWNFELEATKYCKLDCRCLHQVLVKFNKLIFNEFNINIHKALTLPALAMRIYKTHYMPANTICQITGRVDAAIRTSYSGGAVDVYIPHNRITGFFTRTVKALFKLLYYYDVNSLYPFIMSENPMPVGLPTAFEGDIRKIEPDAFGFFYCNINSPNDINHPILQRKIKGRGTVAGIGSWTGWISSIEMDNAMKFGYTFEILKGYQFEKANIFSEYINKMYELRLQFEKGHPMNLIAKLLMNSLYGKFGMKVERTTVDIFNLNNDADKLALRELLDTVGESIQDFIELENNKYLFVRNTLSTVFKDEMYHGSDVNIAIASTITAGARVFMSAFKNNPLYRLYYSDTDSIIIDRLLNPKLVGKALGQLKLEHIIDRAVFLAGAKPSFSIYEKLILSNGLDV